MTSRRNTTAIAALLVIVGAFARTVPAAAQTGPFYFYGLTPCRVADTRETGPLQQGGYLPASRPRNMTIKNFPNCGVPADAKAVSLNLTVVSPTADGYIALWAAGSATPLVSNINFRAGEPALGNGAIVPLAATTPDLALVYGTATGYGWVHVILDVDGYFK